MNELYYFLLLKKMSNLKLKTWPKQLLSSLPLDIITLQCFQIVFFLVTNILAYLFSLTVTKEDCFIILIPGAVVLNFLLSLL